MKETLIFGINRFAQLLCEYMVEDGWRICAFVVDEKYKPAEDSFCQLPIVCTEQLLADFPPQQYNIILALGYGKMNELRATKHRELKEMGYEIIGYQHPTALVMAEQMGEGNIFFENVTVGKHTKMGEGNIFYPCAHVAHHSTISDFNFFAISCSVAGSVQIGNNCFFGNHSTVKNGIRIHDYTLVGAGCYLASDTEATNEVYVPARSVRLEGKNSLDML